jgi:co-chaperonin GroES (HSP10)
MRKVVGAKPTGHYILVEMLDPQEVLGTVLSLGQKTKVESPQGYIVEIGPAVDVSIWGISVGDRVLLQGTYVPVPRFGNGRDMGLVQAHDIKAVLTEESPLVLNN